MFSLLDGEPSSDSASCDVVFVFAFEGFDGEPDDVLCRFMLCLFL